MLHILINSGIQIDHNVDGGDENLSGDKNNH
jgi:hypothetical protein